MYYICDQFGFNDDLLIKESAVQECDARKFYRSDAVGYKEKSSRIKREVRCKSGAIPVAVKLNRESPIVNRELLTTHSARLTADEKIPLLILASSNQWEGSSSQQARRPAKSFMYHGAFG